MEKALERKAAIASGEADLAAKQHAAGKLTARERVDKLFDPGSFVELFALASDGGIGEGVVTGYGTVDGRPVYAFAQDATVKAGAVTAAHASKIVRTLNLAGKCGAPIVGMYDSAGARLDEGSRSLEAYGELYANIARLSGVVPMIGVIAGDCVGAASALPALADIVIAVDAHVRWAIVGPAAAGEELGERIDAKELTGAAAHARRGGISFVCAAEDEAIAKARAVLALLPDNNLECAPDGAETGLDRKMASVDSDDAQAIVLDLLDAGSVMPLSAEYATDMMTVLGRIGGQSAGVIAASGFIGGNECRKAARFIRLCDCFNIPVIELIDVSGLSATRADMQTESIKAAAQLAYASAEATVPVVRVVTGDAIGAGYSVFGGRLTADITYAWPGAVISPISPESAVALYDKDEIEASDGDPKAERARLAERYASEKADGVAAAVNALVDDVIDPADTRRLVIAALGMLESKRDARPPKKHGNLPL